MSINRYKVAIVGTGAITATHVNAMRAIPDFNVAGILGRDYERTRKVAAGLELHAFKDYEEILSDPDIKVIDIATSSHLHADYGIKASQHHKNLIIEKPIDTSPEKAAELINLCERNGCLLEVIYQHRYDENIQLIKDLIERNILGKVNYGKFSCHPRRDLEYYRSDIDKCRGVLKNNAIHYIDLMIYLMGKEPIASWGVIRKTRQELEVEDYANVLLEFGESTLFEVAISTNVKKSLPTIMEIHGEKGSLIFWGNKIKYLSFDSSLCPVTGTAAHMKLYLFEKLKIPLRFNEGSHEHVFRNYLCSLQGKQPVSVDGKTALASLKVVNEIYFNAEQRSRTNNIPAAGY
jgi:predicted dehydrogenase